MQRIETYVLQLTAGRQTLPPGVLELSRLREASLSYRFFFLFPKKEKSLLEPNSHSWDGHLEGNGEVEKACV